MRTLFLTKEARIYNGAKAVYSINGAGKTGQLHVRKMKLEHCLIPYTKINSEQIKYLNVRLNTIKLLEEKIGGTLSYINHRNMFFKPSTRVMEIKTKIDRT